MSKNDKFKNSPIHDKAAIIELMDQLDPGQMIKVVEFIQQQLKIDNSANSNFDSEHENRVRIIERALFEFENTGQSSKAGCARFILGKLNDSTQKNHAKQS